MYHYEEMIRLNADGIDFYSLSNSLHNWSKFPYIASYTKEQFEYIRVIPKTPYRFWKMINGKKIYLDELENNEHE